MNSKLLKQYIRTVLESTGNAHVADQLVNTKDSERSNKEEEENEIDDVNEFSTTGSIVGYMAPLGLDAQDMGVKKKTKRSKSHWY